MRTIPRALLCLVLVAAVLPAASAAGRPFGIDHRLNRDDRGIWNRSNQLTLQDGAALVIVAGALWEGDQTRLGHTTWQSVDSVVAGTASAAVLKLAFARARPTQTDNPNEWFKGRGHNSFPEQRPATGPTGARPRWSSACCLAVLRWGGARSSESAPMRRSRRMPAPDQAITFQAAT